MAEAVGKLSNGSQKSCFQGTIEKIVSSMKNHILSSLTTNAGANNQFFYFSQAIVKIIPMLGSLQSRVLDILYAHMDNTAGNLVKKLFGKVIEESHSIFNKFKAIDKLSSEEKHRLMYHDVLSCIYEKTVRSKAKRVQNENKQKSLLRYGDNTEK